MRVLISLTLVRGGDTPLYEESHTDGSRCKLTNSEVDSAMELMTLQCTTAHWLELFYMYSAESQNLHFFEHNTTFSIILPLRDTYITYYLGIFSRQYTYLLPYYSQKSRVGTFKSSVYLLLKQAERSQVL